MNNTDSALLIFFGTLAISFGAVLTMYLRPIRRAQRSPITPSDKFRHSAAETVAGAAGHLRLSPVGRAVMFYVWPIGILGVFVTWATLHHLIQDYRQGLLPTAIATVIHSRAGIIEYQFEVDGRTYSGSAGKRVGKDSPIEVHYLRSDPSKNQPIEPQFPVSVALLAPAMFDFVALWLLLTLRRHYVLLKNGRLTLGIVVAYGISGQPRLGLLIPTIYDFLPTGGNVVRGRSWLSSYSRASSFFKTSVGAFAKVLYLDENPRCNGLRLALLWEV